MSIQSEKIASLIKDQLPEFVRSDYQTFVAFLEAYYEFLEQDRNARDSIRNAQKYQDIDNTIDIFIDQFKKELAKDIPEILYSTELLNVDKVTLYKNIKDFYQSKGSEKSYNLLLRILFNDNVSFFYPSTVLLRPSDGKWTNDKTIRVSKVQGDPFRFSSTLITGQTSGTTAIVENVLFFQDGSNEVYELFLNAGSLKDSFIAGENVSVTIGTQTLIANVYHSFTGANFTNPGTGYNVGDIIGVSGGSGVNASAKVSYVGSLGEIKKVTITNFGSAYNTPPILNFTSIGDGNAVGIATSGALCEYAGYYVGVDGQPSENIKIQDSKYYQAFSYVIKIGQSINVWRDIVKKVLHPAGMALFGEVAVSSSAAARVFGGQTIVDNYVVFSRTIRLLCSVRMSAAFFEPTIIIYNSADVGITANLQPIYIIPNAFLANLMSSQDLDQITRVTLFVNLQSYQVKVSLGAASLSIGFSISSTPTNVLGSSYASIEQFKFRFPPYTVKNQAVWGPTGAWNQTYTGPNAGYWNSFANTQLSAFAQINIGDMLYAPTTKRTNICPEPYVIISN